MILSNKNQKFISSFAAGLSMVFLSALSHGGDFIAPYSIAEAMENEEYLNRVGNEMKFYFGDQPHPPVKRQIGNYKTNKKTHLVDKSEVQACQDAFYAALRQLQARAVKEGGNAVINIKSYYKKTLNSSETHYRCGTGTFFAGVALIGDVVLLEESSAELEPVPVEEAEAL